MKTAIRRIGRRKNETDGESIFYKLVEFMIKENYTRAEPYKSESCNKKIEEGEENHDLVGLLFVWDCENDSNSANKKLSFEKMDSLDSLLKKVISESKKDGGYAVRDKINVSNQALFYPQEDVKKRFGVGNINDAPLLNYLPDDFTYYGGGEIEIGGKTTAALSMGLTGNGGKAYLIKQSAYDGKPLGKLAVFGENGLEMEFFFLKTDGSYGNEFYFNAKEKDVGVVRLYKFDEKQQKVVLEYSGLVKPKELERYIQSTGELNLYSFDEATSAMPSKLRKAS